MKHKPSQKLRKSRRRKLRSRWHARQIADATTKRLLTGVICGAALIVCCVVLMVANAPVRHAACQAVRGQIEASHHQIDQDLVSAWKSSAEFALSFVRSPSRRPPQGRSKSALRLRTPITARLGRRLRICSVARFSTDEQRRQSIAAQHRFNRNALESTDIVDFEWEEVSDEGISGELRDRPGIERLRTGIAGREWDLIVCEDSSRLYRNVAACLDLVGSAVDNKVRVICMGDEIDTAEEDWSDRLLEAQQHHCRDNRFTRRRIKRSFEDLWELGAALGAPRPGYLHLPTKPATEHDPAEGPFFDEIDPQWQSVVHEAFERIAGTEHIVNVDGVPQKSYVGEAPWSVAKWLTEKGLPKMKNGRGPWNERNVISMIRMEVYRGEEYHSKMKNVKKFATGKSEQERNDPNEMRHRLVPQFRIVPDWLWYQANSAIDARQRKKNTPHGVDHPLYGIPRDSRGPLSDSLFICDRCEQKMNMDGRREGGYRCSMAKAGHCWNKATTLRDLAHQRLGKAIGEELLAAGPVVDSLIEFVQQLFHDDQHRQQRVTALEKEITSIQREQSRLINLARTSDAPPKMLLDEMREVELKLGRLRGDLSDVEVLLAARKPELTKRQIVDGLHIHTERLVSMSRETGITLQHLIPGKIRAVPFQQFGSTNVVLRAEFELHLVNLLPGDLLAALRGVDVTSCEWSKPIAMRVDLFEPSQAPKFAMQALTIWESDPNKNLIYTKIGKQLGISKRVAHLAVKLGEAMRAAGITDPYIRLTEPPANAGRWRTHARFRDDPAIGQHQQDHTTSFPDGGGADQPA